MQRHDPSAGDDVAQCWKDLEAETGFKSYVDYVRAYEDRDRQSLVKLRSDLEQDLEDRIKRHRHTIYRTDCLMLELYKDANSILKQRRRRFSVNGTGILEALQDPPRDICVQVFIWRVETTDNISPPLVDAFGLGLGINPQFFKALYLLVRRRYLNERNMNYDTELRPLRSDFVVRGNAVITISRYRPGRRDSVPVVLIAGYLTTDDGMRSVLDCVDQELREAPALQLPANEIPESGNPGSKIPATISGKVEYSINHGTYARPDHDNWICSYLELLGELLRSDGIQGKNDIALSFVAILPVLQLDSLWMRKSCRLLRLMLPTFPRLGTDFDVDITHVHVHRQDLRRLVEDVEDFLDHLETHVTWEGIKECLEEPIYEDIKQQLRHCCLQARRLEAETRDTLQLEAGFLALQESRKSIELSNYQIQEGKRVKTFTILAFVYVPLNLATSIFGMNLQQLNSNGQQIWVFIITAVTAILVTAGLWFCFEQINDIKAWQENGRGGILWKDDKSERKYFVATRVAMLVWLVKNGHVSWMLKSGAWWRILVNDQTRLRNDNVKNMRLLYIPELLGTTAGDYVMKFGILRESKKQPYFHPFGSEQVSWKKGS